MTNSLKPQVIVFYVSLTAFDYHANYIVNRLQDSQKVVTLMLFQGKGPVPRSSEQDSLYSSVHEKTKQVFQGSPCRLISVSHILRCMLMTLGARSVPSIEVQSREQCVHMCEWV